MTSLVGKISVAAALPSHFIRANPFLKLSLEQCENTSQFIHSSLQHLSSLSAVTLSRILHNYRDELVKPNVKFRNPIIPPYQNKGNVLQLVSLLKVFNFYGSPFF